MNKKLISIIFIAIMIFLLTSCRSSNTNDNKDVSSNVNQEEENQSFNDDYDVYNVLTIGDIEVNDKPEYEGDEYIYTRVKVTNNSDKTIRIISLDFYGYDKEKTIISNGTGQQQGSIEPKQSSYIEGLMDRNEDIENVKINTYSYYIGEKYYMVDLISKIIEVAE